MKWLCVGFVAVVMVAVASGAACGADSTEQGSTDRITRAIATMRKVDFSGLSPAQEKAKEKELGEAWEALAKAGKPGADALKAEIARIDAAGERDDSFKLNAAAALWEIGKLDSAPDVAAVWSGDVALDSTFDSVFYPALDAARTQDPRALPILQAVLRDKKGSVFLAEHYMQLAWPTTQECLWGAYGPAGLEPLAKVLDRSKDGTSLEAAAWLLAKANYEPALDGIRKLATDGQSDARGWAIRALGLYGHPQDFDFLLAGLTEKDPQIVQSFVYALYEYGDLRAVPHLVPLLDANDPSLFRELRVALGHLRTPDGLEALQRDATASNNADYRQWWTRFEQQAFEPVGLTWDAYAAKTPTEKQKALAALREADEQKYRLRPTDRELSHDGLVKAAQEWRTKGRITGGTYEWVEERHVLAAATAADIPLLLDVKAKCYTRLSDECLDEVRILDDLVGRLGRSRYRKDVGICEKVEPLRQEDSSAPR